MSIPIKCRNCNAGQVDGGFAKRVKKQMRQLENQENAELNGLARIKDKEKKRIEEKRIKKKYYGLMQDKSRETPKFVSTCWICGGSGYT